MSSPEVEKFEITDQDLNDEFNINRRTFRMSKNQATYGIWAEPDSDEEDMKPGFGGGRGPSGPDYTAGMNFVSGGVKVGDKTTKEGEKEEEEGDGGQVTDSDEEFEQTMIPRGFGGKKSFGKQGVSYASHKPAEKEDYGSWQKYTTGIGQKLLEKMGHMKGKGLGKNQQGICTPVEAMKRRGKGAVGFHGTERTERSLQDYPVKPTADEEEEVQFQEQVSRWKKTKGQGDKKKKIKYNYVTVDELITAGKKKAPKKENQSDLAKVKVIDMTGKEKRVLSGYHALAHKHDRPDDIEEPPPESQGKKAFDMPELLHNLDILVDQAEENILKTARRARYEEDLVVNLTHEKEQLNKVCKQEEEYIDRLKKVLQIVDECEERSQPNSKNPLSLEECVQIFKRLQDDFYEEYKLYELSSLAVALVFPMMKNEFESWNPLKKPRHGIPTLKNWKVVLEGMGQPLLHEQNYLDPYDRLVWEVWMPHIRTTVSTKWHVRTCDDLLEVLEAWMPLLPDWILSNILEQIVFPKLQAEVESWNPLTDTMPIHSWLHPWLPLMGDRLEPLYGPIRHKLANALVSWHPSDPSAKMMLQPWVSVFTPGHTEAFLVKNIVTKLALCMQEFLINPHEQHLDGWHWVMAWLGVVPRHCLVSILEKNFFPKWLKVLSAWLTSRPNYEEVTKWYTGWKTMFPDEILAESVIKEQFSKALNIMNRAVTGQAQPAAARETVAYMAANERRRGFEQQATYEKHQYDALRGAAATTPNTPMSFKDLVEKRAEEYGILFMPLPGKTHEAKQVYRFGKQQIYFDRNVVFFMDPVKIIWIPVSLNNLVDMAK